MLAAISESLAEAGLSVEIATTELRRHDRTADGVDFVITTDCVSSYMNKEQIEKMVQKLESLKTPLGLDVMDIRVQRLVADRG
jgi:predicted nuclease with TOPRIM domain